MATARPSRLGKGLDGLLTRSDSSDPAAPSLKELRVDDISANPKQPRVAFDDDELNELAESIKAFGVMQPVVVRPLEDGRYELIMGERRLRASQRAELTTIPAIVRPVEDNALLRDALLENLHRSNLNPIEEAMAYQQLLEEFGCSKEELSARIHRSRPQISNTLRLLNLPTSVQTKVAAGVISAGHAKVLLGLPTPEAQEELAQRIIAEGLSVRSTEELVLMGRESQVDRRSPRGPRVPSDHERELAGELSDHFDTRVKVQLGRNKGKITIEFATGEDLERVLAILHGETINT